MKKLVLVGIFLMLSSISNILHAEEQEVQEVQEEQRDQINLAGVGALISTSPYEGVDSHVFAVPIGVWRNEKFFIEGIKGGVIFAESDTFRAAALVMPRLMGYSSDDAPILNGMKDRDLSLDGGVQLRWKVPYSENLSFSLNVMNDLLAEHDGHEISAEISKVFKYSFFQIVPNVGVKWLNEDIVDHYFGVTGEEITATRPQFGGHDTFNYFGNISLYMAVHPKWFIIVRAGAEILGDEIQDSPLVDEEITYNGVLGLTYRF